MTKRKVGSQIGSLTPDHQKLGIDPTPVCAGGMQHTVGNLSTRGTTLLQASSRSEVCRGSYAPSKSRESQLLEFRDSRDKKPFGCGPCGELQNILYGGRWWLPPSSGRGESCESIVACGYLRTKGVPKSDLTNWVVGLMQVQVNN
jgi:hypothetical protein